MFFLLLTNEFLLEKNAKDRNSKTTDITGKTMAFQQQTHVQLDGNLMPIKSIPISNYDGVLDMDMTSDAMYIVTLSKGMLCKWCICIYV